MALNYERSMIMPTVELIHYPFIISLDKYNRNCNTVGNVSTKICVTSRTKDINMKVFIMIVRINEARYLI